MKKQVFNALLCSLLLVPLTGIKAQGTVVDGQSTEGKDFWVTFLKADQDANNNGALQLSISAREACEVTIENPYTGYTEKVDVTANEMQLVTLYKGTVSAASARANMATTGKVCYAVNSEQVDTCALHVTSDKNISLFATNYKYATFDATNILPTASLLDEYIVQTYSPSDHKPASVNSPAAGSHFAVVAAEDDVIVDITPSVSTEKGKSPGVTFATDKLKKGQVYYVWTGNGEGANADLSGTKVVARDGKKIAVFQGCPHTNIPYKVEQRDHIFSQAMPTQYWGNTFVLTASKNRPSDIVRVLALNDETDVYLKVKKSDGTIQDSLIHTIKFATDTKQYWEFEIGTKGDFAKNGSCVVTTSCPCAVHLFLTSQKHDGGSGDGDPAMLWVNPIEQQIDQVTFATYQSLGKSLEETSASRPTRHYINIVTDKPELMKLDDVSIESDFRAVEGSETYYYAQKSLGTNATSHTIKSEGSMFIAHVYGFTDNESYGYSAGGATKPLTQYITINGQIFTPDSKNTLCGEDTVKFACHPDYEFEKIKWNFGDGVVQEFTYAQATGSDSVVPHYYASSGTYDAYVLIYRESSHVCVGQNAVDSIPITVTIGRYIFAIKDIDVPCPEDGKAYIGKVFYTNDGHVNLHGDNVKIEFDATAKADGFKDSELVINDAYFQITIPSTAKPETAYGIHLVITSDCGGTDTTMHFMLNYDKDVITQRYDNVLGLLKDAFKKPLSDFQWYRTSDSTAIEGQTSSVLNFNDLPKSDFSGDTYYVCFTVNKGQSDETKTCACAKGFKAPEKYSFDQNPDSLYITATYAMMTGGKVFVNADWKGKTDIECYAQWITASGKVYQGLKFNIPDGGCLIEAPKEKGLYMLRVTTDGKSRSFKMIINE